MEAADVTVVQEQVGAGAMEVVQEHVGSFNCAGKDGLFNHAWIMAEH
jgi:hypothetical protein